MNQQQAPRRASPALDDLTLDGPTPGRARGRRWAAVVQPEDPHPAVRPPVAGPIGQDASEPRPRRGLTAEPATVVTRLAPIAQLAPDPPGGVEPPRTAPIRFRQVTKRFGAVTAVDRLELTVAPGRVTGLVGPPGSGKTTTLRMLLGLVPPTAGRATFGGATYADLVDPQRRVGAVLEPRFHPGRTGRDHLRVLAATADEPDVRVDEMLALVGLTAVGRRRVATYSTDLRQRLALGGALLGDPDYLVLDEPTGGLHPDGSRWLHDVLRSFAASGRTVLLASQRLAEVADSVDDLVVVAGGRVRRRTTVAELTRSAQAVRLRTGSPRRSREVLTDLGLTSEDAQDEQGPYLRVRGDAPETIGAALFLAGVAVFELSREPFDLETELAHATATG